MTRRLLIFAALAATLVLADAEQGAVSGPNPTGSP